MSQSSQCSLPLSQESYQTLVFLNQQEGANIFPQQNQLFRSSVATADQDGTMGTSEILITRVVGNMQPAAAYAWHQPLSPGQTPVSPESDRHSQPPTPCLTPRSLPGQSSVFQYPSTVPDNPNPPQMMPAIPHLHHPRIKPDPDIENAVVSTNMCMNHQPTIYSVEVPNNCLPFYSLPMPGQFLFDLHFVEERKDIPKSALLTYSDVLKRLFIKQNQKIPLNFKLAGKIPHDSYIRAMTIFKTPGMIREIVTTCPKHKADIASQSLEHPEHFSRSENDGAIYQNDISGRLSVLVPFKSLQANQGFYTALFKFPCFSSCLPKDSYHLAQIIFTLEYRNDVLGRACVDIRVCASPGRDRKVAEEAIDTPPSNKKCKRKGNESGAQSTSNTASTELQPCPVPPKKVVATVLPVEERVQQPKKKQYCVTTDNKEVYHVLMTLKNTIEPFYNNYAGNNNSGQISPGDSGVSSQGIFRYVDKWLDHIDMRHCKNAFIRVGVTDMFQLESFTEKDLYKLGITSKHDVALLLSEIEKHKIEQARYEEMCSQYSSSSQGTYRSSSSQGDSQLGSQGDSQPHSSDYNPYKYGSTRSSSSSSPRGDGKPPYHETIMLQLKRTFCQN